MTLACVRFQSHLKPTFGSELRFLLPGVYNRGWPRLQKPLGFRLHEKWFRSVVYPLIDRGWILEPYSCCKNPVVKTKVSVVQIQMLVFSDFENGYTQGSYLKRMHARVVLGTGCPLPLREGGGCPLHLKERGRKQTMNDLVIRKSGLPPTKQKKT